MALSLWLYAQLCRTHCQLSISNWKVSCRSLTVWSCDRPKSDGILKPMFWIQNSCIEGQKLILILKKYQIIFFSIDLIAETNEGPILERHRRVTCDLLSVDTKWGSLKDSACAAHCLSMGGGRRGGSCQNGVCVCRK